MNACLYSNSFDNVAFTNNSRYSVFHNLPAARSARTWRFLSVHLSTTSITLDMLIRINTLLLLSRRGSSWKNCNSSAPMLTTCSWHRKSVLSDFLWQTTYRLQQPSTNSSKYLRGHHRISNQAVECLQPSTLESTQLHLLEHDCTAPSKLELPNSRPHHHQVVQARLALSEMKKLHACMNEKQTTCSDHQSRSKATSSEPPQDLPPSLHQLRSTTPTLAYTFPRSTPEIQVPLSPLPVVSLDRKTHRAVNLEGSHSLQLEA